MSDERHRGGAEPRRGRSKQVVFGAALAVLGGTAASLALFNGGRSQDVVGRSDARSSQSAATSPVRIVPDGGNIIGCEKRTVDFGTFYRPLPQSVKHSFVVKNLSPSPVRIAMASKSCECTGADIPNPDLPPGGTTTVDVDWHIRNTFGPQAASILVRTDPGDIHLVLSLNAKVSDLIRSDPPEVDLGDIRPGDTVQREIVLYPSPGDALPSQLSVRASDAEELVIGNLLRRSDRATVNVTVRGEPSQGHRKYTIHLLTGDARQPSVSVPVSANHLNLYTPLPQTATLNITAANVPNATRRVLLRNNLNRPAKVLRVVVDDPQMIEAKLRDPDANSTSLDREGEITCLKADVKTTVGKVQLYVEGSDAPIVIPYLVSGTSDRPPASSS